MKDEGRLDRIHVRIEWIIYSEDVYNKYVHNYYTLIKK